MSDDSRFEKIEKSLDAIHCAVVKIENNHGAKLEALFDGQERLKADVSELKAGVSELKTDVSELKTGQASLKTGQREIRKDLGEVKSSMGLLHTMVSGHEARLQKVEGNLAGHLANHS